MAMSPDGKLIAIAANFPFVLENVDVASPSEKWRRTVRSQLVGWQGWGFCVEVCESVVGGRYAKLSENAPVKT